MATMTNVLKTQPAVQQPTQTVTPMKTTTATQSTTAGAPPAPPAPPQNKQLLVKPVTAQAPAAPAMPEMNFDANTMTVEGRLNGLLQNQNPIMQQAASAARQQAAAKGLLNSNLAVQSGQLAVIQSALPIAQQDAQAVYDKSKTEYGLTGQSLLQKQGFEQNSQLQKQGFEQNSQLQKQGFEQNSQLQNQQFEETKSLQAQQFEQNKSLQAEAAKYDESKMRLASVLQLEQVSVEQRNYMDRMNREIEARTAEQIRALDAQAQQQYAQIQAATMDRISAELVSIYQNPNMSQADRQLSVNSVYSRWQQSVDFTAALFDVATDKVPTTSGTSTTPGGVLGTGTSYSIPGLPANFNSATYLQKNPDVIDGYKSMTSPGMSLDQYAAQHYVKFGQKEGRTW